MSKFEIRKISTKFMIASLIIAVVIVASMSLALFLPNSALFKKQFDKELVFRATSVAEKMDEELQQNFAKVKAAASLGQLQATDAQRQETLSSFVKGNPEFFSGSYSPDLTGKNASNYLGAKNDLSSRAYVKDAAEGRTSISDPVANTLDPSKLTIVFEVPLMKDGKPYGFYSSSTEINKATKSVSEVVISETGYAVLLDSKGTFISHPDASLIMKKTINDLNIPELTAAFESAKKGVNTSYSYTEAGVKKIGYASSTKNGFTVLTIVPEKELFAPINEMIRLTIITAIIVILLAIVATYIFATKMAKPILYITDVVKVLSQGDLRPRLHVKSNDELGILADHINEMVESLSATIGNVYAAAASVAISSQQIMASTDEVARGNVYQADRARTMTDLFENLDAAIQEVSVSANQAKGLSQEAVLIAQEGHGIINFSIDKMEQVNKQMAILEKDSNKISEIVEVIDGIAEQTNLLALNAAIEAARAGEHGRGFAVVAEEVRKLAERSGDATKQIVSIINGMQSSTTKCVLAVGEGVSEVSKTRESFDGIVFKVNQTSLKVGEIAVSSVAQASKASELLLSIESVASISEKGAAAAEQTAAASQELSTLSEKLHGSVEMFKYK